MLVDNVKLLDSPLSLNDLASNVSGTDDTETMHAIEEILHVAECPVVWLSLGQAVGERTPKEVVSTFHSVPFLLGAPRMCLVPR